MRQESATNINCQGLGRGDRITPEEDCQHGQAPAADIGHPSIRKGGGTEVGSRDDETNLAPEAVKGVRKAEGIEIGHGDVETGLDPEVVAAKIHSTLSK